MYTYEEALEKSISYFNGDDLAAKVFIDKYALKDNKGNILESDPDQMHHRLAKEFARIESKKFKVPLTEEEIYNLFQNYWCIIPQGSPIFGIGNPYQICSISNCFVLDEPEDSYSGILKVDEQLVNISKRRGGVGISLNKLRPKGFRTNNAANSSTGILSWMIRYSNSIREVGQCIEENQRVLTRNGLKSIKNVSSNDEVWTKIGWVKVNKVLNSGVKNTFRLTTNSGYSIITSEDHIYQTFDYNGNLTETNLNNLKVNDNIVLCLGNVSHVGNYIKLEKTDYKNSNNKPDNCILPDVLDEKLAYLLGYGYGYIINDEYGDNGLDLACSNDYIDIKLKIDKYYNDIFNYKINYRNCDGDLERLSINNNIIIQWLKYNELLKQKVGSLIFPEKILKSPISVQLSFLSGYFDADGDCISTKGGYRFRSIDKSFLENVQVILSSVGIASKLSAEDRSEKNCNNLWSLAIVGNISQTRFRSLFNESIKVGLVDFIASKDYWLTPFKANTFDIKYNKYSYCPDNSQYLSFKTVNRLALENQPVITTLLQDKVKSIELIGERETYDLVLEKEHLFWCEGLYVHNSGRRGALMLTLNVHHPDIEDFITAKNDGVSVTGANITVHLTDEFLSAVENNEQYEQRFPLENPTFTRMVSAQKIWNMIIHNAWLRAEPGIQFIDLIKRESPPDCYSDFRTSTSNPCQPGWAKVITKNGIKTFDDIEIGTEIWSNEGWTKITNKVSTGRNEIYKYVTTAGIFYGTSNHQLVSSDGIIEAEICEDINIIVGPKLEKSTIIPSIVMDGLVFGDGSVHKASNNLVYLIIGEDDQDYFDDDVSDFLLKERSGLHKGAWEITTSITSDEIPLTYNRKIPDRFIHGSFDEICSFLRGIYSANGSVCGNRITLKSSSFQVIEDVQLMLSSIGIKSYWTKNKSHDVEFSNGTYTCKESYDLNISTDRIQFMNLIGFIQQYKNYKIKPTSKKGKEYFDIIKKEFISIEETYDITVDNESHTYWTQGCNVSNCGEIQLSVLDSCRLMAINLFSCIENPFNSQNNSDKCAYFNYQKLYEISQIAQRLMDDLVDLELECIERILNKLNNDPESDDVKRNEIEMWNRIKWACFNGRRTGLGITALGDVLAALNIPYDSDEAIKVTDEIYKTLKFGSYRSSVDMAKELGPFSVWDWQKEKDNPFINRIKNETISWHLKSTNTIDVNEFISGEQLYDDIRKYGRRNIANLTTSPTGTISTQAGMFVKKWYYGTTSGIESLFKKSFIRRKKGNPGDQHFRSDFVDKTGDHWMEFTVNHPGIQACNDISGTHAYVEADKIIWTQKVKLQSAAQKHVDHSISVTCNLPEDIKEEEVAKIYIEAWKSGCKGFTVYRENCRSGVLIDPSKAANKSDRPKELPCDVYHITVGGKSYFVLAGLKNGQLYELFSGKNGFLSKSVKTGKIIKYKKGYKAIFDDETELCPITSMCKDEEEVITRMTSLSIRNGVSLEDIVAQLEKIPGDMNSFARGLARTIKRYIKSGTITQETCPDCGKNLKYQEGCKSCECGWSKCS